MTTTVTKVASAASSTTLLEATARAKYIIENSDANRLYVRLDGGTASATDYSFSLAQNENAEINAIAGKITGIWAADGSGYAHLSEVS